MSYTIISQTQFGPVVNVQVRLSLEAGTILDPLLDSIWTLRRQFSPRYRRLLTLELSCPECSTWNPIYDLDLHDNLRRTTQDFYGKSKILKIQFEPLLAHNALIESMKYSINEHFRFLGYRDSYHNEMINKSSGSFDIGDNIIYPAGIFESQSLPKLFSYACTTVFETMYYQQSPDQKIREYLFHLPAVIDAASASNPEFTQPVEQVKRVYVLDFPNFVDPAIMGRQKALGDLSHALPHIRIWMYEGRGGSSGAEVSKVAPEHIVLSPKLMFDIDCRDWFKGHTIQGDVDDYIRRHRKDLMAFLQERERVLSIPLHTMMTPYAIETLRKAGHSEHDEVIVERWLYNVVESWRKFQQQSLVVE